MGFRDMQEKLKIFVYLEKFQEFCHLRQNGSIDMILLFCFMNKGDFLV